MLPQLRASFIILLLRAQFQHAQALLITHAGMTSGSVHVAHDDAPPAWHWAMLNDRDRNAAYRVAIERACWHGNGPHAATVLDVGCGAGLLSLIASGAHLPPHERSKAGPRDILACEKAPTVAQIASQCCKDNGCGRNGPGVRVVPLHSYELVVGEHLPEPVDLAISEIVDETLLGEHVLWTLTVRIRA